MRPSHLWAAAAVVLGVTVAGCSGGSDGPDASRTGERIRLRREASLARRSCCLLPVHAQPRRPELSRPGADPRRRLRVQDHRN